MKYLYTSPKYHAFFVTMALASIVLTGCSKSLISNDRKQNHAPRSSKELGVVLKGADESSVAEFLASEPTTTVRIINSNHGLYEIYGTNMSAAKKFFTNKNLAVEVESNHFVPAPQEADLSQVNLNSQKADTSIVSLANRPNPFVISAEKLLGQRLSDESMSFIEACRINPLLAPKIEVAVLKNSTPLETANPSRLTVQIEVGDSLLLRANGISKIKVDPKLEYMWLSPRSDGAMATQSLKSNSHQIRSEETGSFFKFLVAQDTQKNCSTALVQVLVTANPKFLGANQHSETESNGPDPRYFWHLFKIGAHDSWQASTGEGVVVAIIDSGVNYNHPFLAQNILLNEKEIPDNNIDDDQNGLVDDAYGYDFANGDAYAFDDVGHGSHVAGISASKLFGVAPHAKILPIKVGSALGIDYATVAGAIIYAVDQGAKILNLSFGGPVDSPIVHNAIKYAEDHDVLIVVAAGNSHKNNDVNKTYPSNYENKNLLSVAALDMWDSLAEYSNFGMRVHIAAPGGDMRAPILSTYKRAIGKDGLTGMSGTSMAAPVVAGVAAQVLSLNKSLSVSELKAILLESGLDLPSLNGVISSGKAIDSRSAVELSLKRLKGAGDTPKSLSAL